MCIHFLVILSLKTLWAGVKHWRTAPHRFYVYRKPISSPRSRNLKVIKKMCTFEVHLCMMYGQLILSGKPFNTFSMARLKYCNCVWPSLPFPIPPRILLYKSLLPRMACIFFSRVSHHLFPQALGSRIFFSEIRDQNPPSFFFNFFFSFRLWKMCSKYMDFVLQTGCLSHITIILYSCAVCNLHLLHTNRLFLAPKTMYM